jgi:peptidoglycan/xylan/chitin deacetylase (PgdA/CDA1 family)
MTFDGIADADQPWRGTADRWPLVVYFHHVHPAIEHYTSLTPRAFEHALDVLLADFAPLDPYNLADVTSLPIDLPRVLITFDDGYRDNAALALPILRERAISAVFFLVTNRVGQRSADPRQDFLTWDMAEELAEAGHVIGAHTHNHCNLSSLPSWLAQREIEASLAAVGRRFPRQPLTFAYPYGVVPDATAVPAHVLSFGTVRSAHHAWTDRGRPIRRSYLPVGEPERWPELVAAWREQWTSPPVSP